MVILFDTHSSFDYVFILCTYNIVHLYIYFLASAPPMYQWYSTIQYMEMASNVPALFDLMRFPVVQSIDLWAAQGFLTEARKFCQFPVVLCCSVINTSVSLCVPSFSAIFRENYVDLVCW